MIVHIIRLIDWVDRSIDLPAACLLSELNDDNNQLVSDDSDDEDVVYKGDLGIPDVDDCATGSFCSSCAIPPRVAGGLWSDGVGCDACYFPLGVIRLRGRG